MAAANDRLNIWTVYDHPRDQPDVFVARRFEIGHEHAGPTGDVLTAPTLEELREKLPAGLVCITRQDGDDPAIVESWL